MTLLELLVKELPKRGGWPKDVWHITQDSDGLVNGYGESEPYLKTEYWNSTGFIRYLFNGERKALSVDWVSSVINREQYEATQQPVWDGEGLPPVGCECEYIGNDTSWGVVKVIGYDEGRVVFKPSGEDYYGIIPGYKSVFRPNRTEADRKREETVESIRSHVNNYNKTDVIQAIGELYDAIAAGKIPGVEISK